MKRPRRPVAWFALLAICFVQLATAAHACTVVAPVALDSPCAEMGMMAGNDTPSGLCLEHCKGDGQLVDHHSPVPVGAGPAMPPIIVADDGSVSSIALPTRSASDPAPPLPVYAASSRLRI